MLKAEKYLQRQLQILDHHHADNYTLYLAIKNYLKRYHQFHISQPSFNVEIANTATRGTQILPKQYK
jgi:hypothetical protein